MATSPAISHIAPSYTPAPHLIAGSLFTASQLIFHFHDFYESLEFISCAPAFVFERLVGNLNVIFTTALERERLQHATALEKSHEKNKTLQLSNDQLKKELSELKEIVSAGNNTSLAVKNPVIETFTYTERNPVDMPCTKVSSVLFTARYSAPPGLPLGFNLINTENNGNPCVDVYPENIREDRFDIRLNTKGSARFRGVGCTWLEVEKDDPDFQFGRFNTLEDHPTSRTQVLTSRYTAFSRPYRSRPHVVVWLTAFDMNRERVWRLTTYATGVTTDGFDLHVDTWSDTILYSAAATWVAYPADRANISSGRFSVADIRHLSNPQTRNSGYIHFGNKVFSAPPRVLVAINTIDMSQKQTLRLHVKASSISTAGMTWHIDSWDDTILSSAGASYIALG